MTINVAIANRIKAGHDTLTLDIEKGDLLDALALVERPHTEIRTNPDAWSVIEVDGKKAYRTPWGSLAIVVRKKRGTREYLIEAFPQIIAAWLTGNAFIRYYKNRSSFDFRWVDSEGETVTHKNAVI